MLPPTTKIQYVGKTGLVLFLAGMIPGLLYGLVSLVLVGSYHPLAFFIAVLGGAVLAESLWITLVAKTIGRSRRRMGDPIYRAKLVEFGMFSQAGRR